MGRKKDYTLRLAVKAIHESDASITGARIAGLLNRSPYTISLIYRELGIKVVKGRKKGHPSANINTEQRKAIVDMRNNNHCATLQDIGDNFHLSRERVRQILKSELRPTSHFIQRYYCINCGKVYIPKHKSGLMFCSRKCRKQYLMIPLICDNCGKLFYRQQNVVLAIEKYKTTRSITTCSYKCRGEYYKGRKYMGVSIGRI
jgi:IS30 family transposase